MFAVQPASASGELHTLEPGAAAVAPVIAHAAAEPAFAPGLADAHARGLGRADCTPLDDSSGSDRTCIDLSIAIMTV